MTEAEISQFITIGLFVIAVGIFVVTRLWIAFKNKTKEINTLLKLAVRLILTNFYF